MAVQLSSEFENLFSLCRSITTDRFSYEKDVRDELVCLGKYEEEIKKIIGNGNHLKISEAFLNTFIDLGLLNKESIISNFLEEKDIVLYVIPQALMDRNKNHPAYKKLKEKNDSSCLRLSLFAKHAGFFASESTQDLLNSAHITRTQQAEYFEKLHFQVLKLIIICINLSDEGRVKFADIRKVCIDEYETQCALFGMEPSAEITMKRASPGIEELFGGFKNMFISNFPSLKPMADKLDPQKITEVASSVLSSPESYKILSTVTKLVNDKVETNGMDGIAKLISNTDSIGKLLNEDDMRKISDAFTPMTNKALDEIAKCLDPGVGKDKSIVQSLDDLAGEVV